MLGATPGQSMSSPSLSSPAMGGGMGGSAMPMGNQQSFTSVQNVAPGMSGNNMMNRGRFAAMRQLGKPQQVSRYNHKPPQGLADSAGIQAMQAKLGSLPSATTAFQPRLTANHLARKYGAMSPALAGQDTSALGMSFGVPPMNPQQPMSAPPPAQAAPAPMGAPQPGSPSAGGMPPQAGYMPPPTPAAALGTSPPMPAAINAPMPPPLDPSQMQAPGAETQIPPNTPNQMQGSAPPPMPGDVPPAAPNGGNLVSGLAAQQEGLDEADPQAAMDELGIEAAPGLDVAGPATLQQQPTPQIGKIAGDFPVWHAPREAAPVSTGSTALRNFGSPGSAGGQSPISVPTALKAPTAPKMAFSNPDLKTAGFGSFAGKLVRGLKNVRKQTIVPRPGEPVLAHAVPQQYSHLPVGSRVPGEVPMSRPRAFGSIPTPRVPTRDDHVTGMQMVGGAGLLGGGASAAALHDAIAKPAPMAKAGTFAAPVFKGKKIIKDPYIEKIDAMQKRGEITPFAHSFIASCVEHGIDPIKVAHKLSVEFGKEAAAEVGAAMMQAGPYTLSNQEGVKCGFFKEARPGLGGLWNAARSAFGAGVSAAKPIARNMAHATPRMPTPGPGTFSPSVQAAHAARQADPSMSIQSAMQAGRANPAAQAATRAFTAPTATGVAPRTWGDFGKSMFQGGSTAAPNTGWRNMGANLGDRALGAGMGAMAGGEMQGNEDGFWNAGALMGGLYGAAAGTGARGNLSRNRMMGAMQRPMQQAFAGGAAGTVADMAGNALGMEPTGLGTMGARLGFGSGLFGNAARANRTFAQQNNMQPAGWARAMKPVDGAMNAFSNGTQMPLTAGWNAAKGMTNKVLGTPFKMSPYAPGVGVNGGAGVNRAAYGLGALGVGIPLASGAVGLANNAVQGTVQDAVHRATSHIGQGIQNYAQGQGLMDEGGNLQFGRMAQNAGGHMVDKVISAMGMDPSQMSTADKWALLGGGATAGYGALSGNPWLAAGGLGAMGYGARNPLLEMMHNAARVSNPGTHNPNHALAAMTPQSTGLSGQGWRY